MTWQKLSKYDSSKREKYNQYRRRYVAAHPNYYKEQYQKYRKPKLPLQLAKEAQERLKRRLDNIGNKFLKCPKCNDMVYSYNQRFKKALKKHLEEVHSY